MEDLANRGLNTQLTGGNPSLRTTQILTSGLISGIIYQITLIIIIFVIVFVKCHLKGFVNYINITEEHV